MTGSNGAINKLNDEKACGAIQELNMFTQQFFHLFFFITKLLQSNFSPFFYYQIFTEQLSMSVKI